MSVEDEQQAITFMRALFGRASRPGRISVWSRQTKRTEHCPLDPDAAARAALALAARGQCTYVGLCTRPPGLSPNQRGKSADAAEMAALWIEVDHAGGYHAAASGALPPVHEARGLPEACGFPEPSMVVDSGGGYHFYWLLDEVLDLSRDRRRAAAAVRHLQRVVKSRALARGWHVDTTSDLSRVLRVPGTVNTKGRARTGGADARVALVDAPLHVYTLSLLESIGSAAGTPPVASPPAGIDSPANAPPPANPRSAPLPIDPSTLPDRLVELAARAHALADPETRAFALRILSGEGARLGERDAEAWGAARTLALVGADLGEDAVLAALAPWIAATRAADPEDASNPRPVQESVEEKVRRAVAGVTLDRAERSVAEDEVLGALAPPKRAEAAGPPPDGPLDYTSGELDAIAAREGCTRGELQQRWIIQRGGAYYVLASDGYKSPVPHCDLDPVLRDDLSRAPVDLTAYTESGVRPAKVPDILRKHSTVARKSVADVTIRRTRFDPRDECLYEACCPLRDDLEPAYDERVEEWLRLLGGEQEGKLLDWIATITRLDRPTCIVYLAGKASAGKNMIVDGLARLWSREGATDMEAIAGNFNADLARCPLVVADEHLPQVKGISAFLRSLVGTSTRTLQRKYMPNMTLRGCFRVMMIANNDDMLHTVSNEEHSAQDLEAIALRFLYVKVGEPPKAYLESIGGRGNNGRPGTSRWVDEDVIAKHALWLKKTREVHPGSRFLVEGHRDKMHTLLVTRGKVAQLCAEWIARDIDQPLPNTRDFVRVGHGRILVNVNALAGHWHEHVRSDEVPATARIGRTLASWSRGEVSVGPHVFHDVPPDIILDFAEKNQIGTRAELEARIAGEQGARGGGVMADLRAEPPK